MCTLTEPHKGSSFHSDAAGAVLGHGCGAQTERQMVQGWQEEFLLSSVSLPACVCACTRLTDCLCGSVLFFPVCAPPPVSLCIFKHHFVPHTPDERRLWATLAVPLLTASCCRARCQEMLPPAQPPCLHNPVAVLCGSRFPPMTLQSGECAY